jgi:hypothetical protein
VTASDRRSNPGAARQGEARLPLWVDNTPPAALILRHTIKVGAKGSVTLTGAAWDDLSPLQGVDYAIDDGAWRAATIDGAPGKRRISFGIETPDLAAGKRRIKVRALDQAGNSAGDEVRVKVEAAAPKP